MTYGAETWALTKHQEKKLAVAQRSIERSFLNITKRDKIQNEVIRSKTWVKDIAERVRCMRGQWAGHVAGMSNTRWAKTTSGMDTQKRKTRERPKRRSTDNIEDVDSSQWMSSSRSKCMVRVVEATCQQRHERLRWWWWWWGCGFQTRSTVIKLSL